MSKKKSPFEYKGMDKKMAGKDEPKQHFAWMSMMKPGDISIESRLSSPKSGHWVFIIAAIVIMSLFGLFAVKLFALQVTEGDVYSELASGNRIRESVEYAPRGRILDRNGVVLAENEISFQLSATPYNLEDDEVKLEQDLKQLSKHVPLKSKEILRRAYAQGEEYPLPVPITQSLSHKQALAIEQILPDIPGFSMDTIPTRVYNSEAGLAHILGYVGRVSQEDLDADETGTLLGTDFIGKGGIEKQYDEILRGVNGRERIEADAIGRPVRLLAKVPPENGNDIVLTIDIEVQKRLERELRTQMAKSKTTRSAGVLMDPQNGEVIAMVSIPFYDNNLFSGGISEKDFSKLVNDPLQPLVNKAASGGYSSGSTIKPIVASAALEEGVVKPDTVIVDRGFIELVNPYNPADRLRFNGWRPQGLGPMNVRSAIAWSSNIYFYTVGGGFENFNGLGVDRLTSYYREFGLGQDTGLDLPEAVEGRVPDPEYKREVLNDDWYTGDTYNISIGQGDLLVSPLHLAVSHSAIANNGYVLQPQLLYKVGDEVVLERVERNEVPVSKSNLQIVREGMRQVLTDGTTCECTFSKVPHKVAGKSGTAETDTPGGRRAHAWYSAFAPYENPEIIGAVIIEEGSGGSRYSAPAIAGAMETYFQR